MADVQIIVVDQRLQNLFRIIRVKTDDTQPLMRQLTYHLHKAVEDNFQQEGRPRWADLKPATWKQREKQGYTGPILQRTGALKRSITEKTTKTEAIVGTNKVYAPVHQFGCKHTLARPFLSVTQSDIDGMVKTVEVYYMEILR